MCVELLNFFYFHSGSFGIYTVQSDSNNISLNKIFIFKSVGLSSCRTIDMHILVKYLFLTMTFWMWIPDTIKNGAIPADMEQSIWHSDDVEMCLLFIWEIRIGNPNIRHHPLIKFKVTEITQVLIVQAWINPGLSQERLHG